MTLQLGRFQLCIPLFGRAETRPDTPNVAEIDIERDFVRLNSNETYTLNGRTIRLLGGNFENYPPLTHGSHPPPYNEAMRYKLYGPPPEYLSRDRLNVTNSVDEEARSNVEMPPCYDELASNVSNNGNNDNHNGNNDNRNGNNDNGLDTACGGNPIVINRDLVMSNIIGNVCSITGIIGNDSVSFNGVSDIAVASSSNDDVRGNVINDNGNLISSQSNNNDFSSVIVEDAPNNNNDAVINDSVLASNVESNGNIETINSIIDNLPAIDSDLNANDSVGC